MLQKLGPLIILLLFAGGAYFMINGMQNAMDMADHKKVKAKKAAAAKK
ncbi:hypothetical protein [Sulfurovum sp.]|nr:hypothetical protein [Sulfurovum sp.]